MEIYIINTRNPSMGDESVVTAYRWHYKGMPSRRVSNTAEMVKMVKGDVPAYAYHEGHKTRVGIGIGENGEYVKGVEQLPSF